MLEIGQKVRYKVNGYEVVGAVIEDLGEFVTIMTHFIRGMRVNNVVNVDREELTLITE